MPPVGLSCNTCPIPFATVTGVTMTYEAEVSNPGGCKASDEVTIIPICVGENLFIPNTFSPNGDGNNDVSLFGTKAKGVRQVIPVSIQE